MKKIIFLMAMLVGLSAFAQNEGWNEEWSFEQEIPVKLKDITVKANAQVKIIQSDKNSVRVTSDNSDIVRDLTKDIVTLTGTSMMVGDNKKVEIFVADLTTLNIIARDNSKVFIDTDKDYDTITIANLTVIATDNASISIAAPINNEMLSIHSRDNASIQVLVNVNSVNLSYMNSDNSMLSIKDVIKATSKCYGSNNNQEISYVDESLTHLYGKNPKGRFYDAATRLNAGFYFGWNNWGPTPYTGLVASPAAVNASCTKTSLSALTFEVSYSLICHPHFAAGIGVGIGRNKFKFVNGIVDYGDNGFTIPEGDELVPPYNDDVNNWESYYFKRQVSLPIHFNYYASTEHWKGFSTSITVIPLLHLFTKKSGLTNIYDGETYIKKTENPIENPIRSFGLDLRISLGYSWFNVYLQSSLIQLFHNYNLRTGYDNYYPVSVGLGIAF